MIQADDLVKRFGAKEAVNHVSFRVDRGEIVGFLGPNGAGKTTTMRILTGFLPATSGEVTLDGHPVSEESKVVRKMIGYLPENNPLYEDLRVREYLGFRASLKGLPRAARRKRIDEVMESCDIVEVRDRMIGACSKGFRQRVGLADALLADPPLLVLDEPTVGLDPGQIVHVRELIRELSKDHTVLLSTHILPEVEAICSRVLIIHEGSLLFDGSVDDLQRGLSGGAALVCTVAGDLEAARACLAGVAGVERVEALGESGGAPRFRLALAPGQDPRVELFRALAAKDLPLLELMVHRVSLEEAFLSITTQEPQQEVAP